MPDVSYLDDENLRKLIGIMRELVYVSACVRFTDLMKRTGWHQQKLSRVLKRGIERGLIIKCGDKGYTIGPLGGLFPHSLIVKERITFSVVKATSSYLTMRHDVTVLLQNVGFMDLGKVYIRVYGDIDWDEPLRFKCGDMRVVEKLDRSKCPLNMCDLIFKLSKPIPPGSVVDYRYSFNLFYYPPKDYFIIDILSPIKDVLIRMPKYYSGEMQISIDKNNVILTGRGQLSLKEGKKYITINGILLKSPGTLKVPIQMQLRSHITQ